jgi:hypothetical protein
MRVTEKQNAKKLKVERPKAIYWINRSLLF